MDSGSNLLGAKRVFKHFQTIWRGSAPLFTTNMNERTSEGFVQLASLKLSGPIFLLIVVALLNWGLALGLGFALGAAAGLAGAYFSWMHLKKLSEQLHEKTGSQVQRAAFGGTLAGIALMALVLAVAALLPWLNLFATAAGLFAPRLLIGLSPFLRRSDGRNW